MTVILTTIMLLCMYLFLCQLVGSIGRAVYDMKIKVVADVILLFMYTFLCGVVGIFYMKAGHDPMVIFYAILVGVIILFILLFDFVRKHKREIKYKYGIYFLLYFLLILYVTLFSRLGADYTGVVMEPFGRLNKAIEIGSFEPLVHVFLNIGLFVPFGYFIPAMDPKHFRKISIAFLGGLMLSTIVESLQLVIHLGECDLGDIMSNTIGTILGYLCCRFMWQVRKNWTIHENPRKEKNDGTYSS